MPDELEWRRPPMGFFVKGRQRAVTSPLDLLRVPALTLRSRLRMGIAVVRLQRGGDDVGPFEGITARAWITNAMGREAYDTVWGPLLRGKFGDRADDISMAWLWSKLTLRRRLEGKEAREERLGYPRGSWQSLFERLRAETEDHGGRVLLDRPAARLARGDGDFAVTPAAPGSYRLGHDPRAFDPAAEPEHYDAVIATVPNDVFAQLLAPGLTTEVGDAYRTRLAGVESHAALCLLLELDRRFSPFYWTNVADRRLPFVGLIEQTNFVEPEHYQGRRFLYVANYLAAGHELLDLDADQLLARYTGGLKAVNPAFSTRWVRAKWLFLEPHAQPIVTVGYRAPTPPLETPAAGLLLANTTQIYPEDRGTNYAVREGERAAAQLTSRSLPVSTS